MPIEISTRSQNLHLIQADLGKLPFDEQFFDFISCDQVIHHTPDTRKSLAHLVRHLAPGGHIGIYIYKKKAPIREFCDDYIRQFTVGMPAEQCLEICAAITKFGRSLSRLASYRSTCRRTSPFLGIKAGKYDFQRFIYWNVFKCYWNDTMDWDSNVITNFDWYHPRHAHRHTPEEVRSWFDENGLDVVHFDVVESGISVIGHKRTRGVSAAVQEESGPMCAIAGIIGKQREQRIDAGRIEAMIASIKHRGPDETGYYRTGGVQLAMARLRLST